MRKYISLIILVILFTPLFTGAQTSETYVTDLQTDKTSYQTGEEINGLFNIRNLSTETSSSVYYKIFLIEENTGLDFENSSERFGPVIIEPGSDTTHQYSFFVTGEPSGNVRLGVVLEDEVGIPITWDTVPVFVMNDSVVTEGKDLKIPTFVWIVLGIIVLTGAVFMILEKIKKKDLVVMFMMAVVGAGLLLSYPDNADAFVQIDSPYANCMEFKGISSPLPHGVKNYLPGDTFNLEFSVHANRCDSFSILKLFLPFGAGSEVQYTSKPIDSSTTWLNALSESEKLRTYDRAIYPDNWPLKNMVVLWTDQIQTDCTEGGSSRGYEDPIESKLPSLVDCNEIETGTTPWVTYTTPPFGRETPYVFNQYEELSRLSFNIFRFLQPYENTSNELVFPCGKTLEDTWVEVPGSEFCTDFAVSAGTYTVPEEPGFHQVPILLVHDYHSAGPSYGDGSRVFATQEICVEGSGVCPGEEEEKTDMCPNILGEQSTIPENYSINNEGDCVESILSCTSFPTSGSVGDSITFTANIRTTEAISDIEFCWGGSDCANDGVKPVDSEYTESRRTLTFDTIGQKTLPVTVALTGLTPVQTQEASCNVNISDTPTALPPLSCSYTPASPTSDDTVIFSTNYPSTGYTHTWTGAVIGNTPTVQGTFEPGNYQATVVVRGEGDVVKESTCSFTIDPPEDTEFNVSCRGTATTTSIVWEAVPVNGVEPISYVWSGIARGSGERARTIHDTTGTYTATVTATDANGDVSTATCSADFNEDGGDPGGFKDPGGGDECNPLIEKCDPPFGGTPDEPDPDEFEPGVIKEI